MNAPECGVGGQKLCDELIRPPLKNGAFDADQETLFAGAIPVSIPD